MNSLSDINLFSVIPFLLLLVAIAFFPWIHRKWWEKNYVFISGGMAAITAIYYAVGMGSLAPIVHALREYFSFIVLIGSLFVVTGGILIRLKGKASPVGNSITLLIGALASNIVGTTGASMILIRPYLNVNKSRLRPYHIVFFIFLVSNIGGALTPIGDPPLFLGYLRGVPFFWILANVWPIWLITIGGLLIVFFLIDTASFKKSLKLHPELHRQDFHEEGQLKGLPNIFFLLAIFIAVFIEEPKYLRESLMLCAGAGSYYTTKAQIHEENKFSFLPIAEVAILFFGIFVTMVPALDWMRLHAKSIGLSTPGHYFWVTGGLSTMLDNAPTYLNFLHAAIGLNVSGDAVTQLQAAVAARGTALTSVSPDIQRAVEVLVRNHASLVNAGSVSVEDIQISYLIANGAMYLKAVSIGAVFFGAMTYIGNGPNFLVKSIAEHHGAKCPSFIEFIVKFSIPVLLPLFILVWWVFFS